MERLLGGCGRQYTRYNCGISPVEGEMLRGCFTVRVSLDMVAIMPRWDGEDTRSLKAEWSSWETVMPDCMAEARRV